MEASENPNNTLRFFEKVDSIAPSSGWQISGWQACYRLGTIAVGLALLAVIIHQLSADGAISSALRGWDLPGDVAKAVTLSEVFGHGLGALAILLSVWWLAPTRRRAVWLAVAITLASGVTANAMKSLFVRVRPHAAESIQIVDPTIDAPADLLSSNLQRVPPSIWDARQRSFPSGHAATAWGLAIGLSIVFPRGIILFVCFATLASLQRLTSGAHFPTDILAGAAIACAVAAGLLMVPRLRKL